jgi:hypothetical protein
MTLNVTNSAQTNNHVSHIPHVFLHKSQAKSVTDSAHTDYHHKPQTVENSAKTVDMQNCHPQRKQFVGSNMSLKMKTMPAIDNKTAVSKPSTSNSSSVKKSNENTENFLPPIKSSFSLNGSTRDDLNTVNSQLSVSRTAMSNLNTMRPAEAADRADMLSDTLIVSKLSPLNKYEENNWISTEPTEAETNEPRDKCFKSLSFTFDDIDDPFIKNALKNKNELDAFIYSAKLQFTRANDNEDCPPPNSPVLSKLTKFNQVVIKTPVVIQNDAVVRNSNLVANINTPLALSGSSISYHLTDVKQSPIKHAAKQSTKSSTKIMNIHGNKKTQNSSSTNDKHTKLPTVHSVNNKLIIDIYIPSGSS